MVEPQKNPNRNRRLAERRMNPRTPGGAVWYVLGFLLLLAIAQAFFFQLNGGETLPYSEFKRLVREDRVQEVTVGEDRIRGVLRGANGEKGRPFTAVRVTDDKLPDELEQHGVKYQGEVPNRWLSDIVGWIIPLVLIVALWTFFFRRIGGAEGGVMSFARSRAKIYADEDVKI